MRLTSATLRASRLRHHGLTASRASSRTPIETLRRLAAVQAQNLAAARWAIGVRSAGSTAPGVDAMFADGSAARSWTMRGTLHLVAVDDLHWMLQLTAARQRASAVREVQARGMTEHDFRRSEEHLVDAIAERGPITRAEALDLLAAAGIEVGGERGYRLIRDAAWRGRVAWGALRGAQQQLVLLPATEPVDRDEALGRFLLRYLTGHAPASLRDFAWWSGLTLGDARRARAVVGTSVMAVAAESDADELLMPADEELAGARPSGVHALPAWDEYVLGYRDRSPVLPVQHATRISPTANGVFLPTIVSAGRIVGTWRQASVTGSTRRFETTVEPFVALSESEAGRFAASAERYARFLGVLSP